MVPGRGAWRGAAHGEHAVCIVELAALVQHVHPPIDVVGCRWPATSVDAHGTGYFFVTNEQPPMSNLPRPLRHAASSAEALRYPPAAFRIGSTMSRSSLSHRGACGSGDWGVHLTFDAAGVQKAETPATP